MLASFCHTFDRISLALCAVLPMAAVLFVTPSL